MGLRYFVAGAFPRVFVVADALDECQTSDGCQRELISQLTHLQRITGASILATSRPVPHIVERFRDCVSLEIRTSRGDIKRYVDGNMRNLPGFVGCSRELQEEITDGIVDIVDGMYVSTANPHTLLICVGSCWLNFILTQ